MHSVMFALAAHTIVLSRETLMRFTVLNLISDLSVLSNKSNRMLY